MIVYQVKDLAAKTCGQPLMAENFDQAVLAVGRLISENHSLHQRASKISVEMLGVWNGETGFTPAPQCPVVAGPVSGSFCLNRWTEAVLDAREADERGDPYFSDKLEEVSDDDK